MAGEGAHLVPGGAKFLRDGRARVAERAGYHIGLHGGLHNASGLAGGEGGAGVEILSRAQRAEPVVEDQRLVASGLGRDPPGAGGGESRLAQRVDGRRDERGTRVPHEPTLP